MKSAYRYKIDAYARPDTDLLPEEAEEIEEHIEYLIRMEKKKKPSI